MTRRRRGACLLALSAVLALGNGLNELQHDGSVSVGGFYELIKALAGFFDLSFVTGDDVGEGGDGAAQF